MVGVMLDTMRQMESHLLMRHYMDFLKRAGSRAVSKLAPVRRRTYSRGRKMIILKTERDLEAMRPACEVASTILEEVGAFIQPGVTTREVDDYAAARMRQHGCKSAFWAIASFRARFVFRS